MSALATFVEIALGTSAMRYTRLTLKNATRSGGKIKRSAAARGDPQASQIIAAGGLISGCKE